MKEYIRSFRTLAAYSTVKNCVILLAVCFVVFSASTASLVLLEENGIAWAFMSGFAPMMSILIPISSITLLQNIFNCNNQMFWGYKYFHSISDSAAKFRRAIMVGNVIALVTTALNWAVVSIFSQLAVSSGVESFYNSMNIFAPWLALIMIAVVNFTGFLKSALARLLFILPACAAGGFIGGFSAGYEDADPAEYSVNGTVAAVALAVGAAVAAGGIVFSALNAEKQWNKEGEKIEKRT